MALRSGMGNLVQRLRNLCNAGTADYTAGTITYWSDDHLQDILDGNAAMLIDSPLEWKPQTIGGGSITYLIAQSLFRDFEEAASGTARWIVRTATGTQVGTANYSTDYRAGRLTFTSDQSGSAYFLTAFTYDIHQAAAEVWRGRLANFASWYDFRHQLGESSEQFSRSQAFKQAKEMLAEMEGLAGSNEVGAGGDVRTSVFVRTDIGFSS